MKKTGGNGGYRHKTKAKETTPGPRRKWQKRDYSGKNAKKG